MDFKRRPFLTECIWIEEIDIVIFFANASSLIRIIGKKEIPVIFWLTLLTLSNDLNLSFSLSLSPARIHFTLFFSISYRWFEREKKKAPSTFSYSSSLRYNEGKRIEYQRFSSSYALFDENIEIVSWNSKHLGVRCIYFYFEIDQRRR